MPVRPPAPPDAVAAPGPPRPLRTLFGTVPRFFVPAGAVGGGRAVIEGPDAAHLARSLRARPGERIVAVDAGGTEHGVVLEEVDAARTTGRVEWSRPATGEPATPVHVLQAVCAEDMDAAVEALAEVGAAAIWPMLTRRTVPRLDAERATRRLERWRSVARQAAALAGRAGPVPVHPLRSLPQALGSLPPGTRVLACATGAGAPLGAAVAEPPAGPLALVIGPEGGLAPDELADVRAAGGEGVHLGPRVLRARLAGAVALGILLDRLGELQAPVAAAPQEAACR
jgi:16S rRNA (uracil1498-N3)-methyltransferase